MATEPRLPFGEEHGADRAAARDEAARAFAVDPSHNVVLEASAGTGKTWVLVTRYVNLLRAGVDPSHILAMTFTRKAASEMRDRIVQQLGDLASRSREDEARWRALRDRLGDIAISTIDAFCYALLREFPLEADLDPGFEIADETELSRLLDEALDTAVRAGRRLASADDDVALLLASMGERRLRTALGVLVDRRLVTGGAIRRFLGGAAGPDPPAAVARAVRQIGAALSAAPGGVAGFVADGPGRHLGFALVADDLEAVCAGAADGALVTRAVVDRLSRYFLKDDGQPRARPAQTYHRDDAPSPAAWTRHSRALAALAPELRAALDVLDRDLNLAMVRGVARVFRIARARYRRALEERAAVDFTEGLARTLRLLRKMDEFAQSRYRLEARYHHVLVDEFQDTNRAQWRLVAHLIESWGEGQGLAHDAPLQPSIFIVGDRKQSIYGFRDADVRMIRRAGRRIGALRPGGDVRRSIAQSFRAAPALLAFANDLFSAIDSASSRADAFRYRRRDHFPVDVDRITREAPVLALAVAEGGARAAEVVADEIARLLAEGGVRDRRTGVPRTPRPGDIAILFRSRQSHRDVEAALERRGVPTYVYKGLGFFEADEVQDLVALLRYLADPASNLRAAALLRSRLVRISDVGLRRLAPGIAAALRSSHEVPALPDEDARVLARVRASLPAWLSLIDRVPPAEVIDRILADAAYAVELGGPRLVQGRENVKKVRALTRRLQNRGHATLGRVADQLTRLSAGDESNAVVDALDAVNLMTIHAAKGLEFPIVFVVNIGRGTGSHADPIVVVPHGPGGAPLVSVDGHLAEARQVVQDRDREETKRLLYVAVTRARERLYLSAGLEEGRLRIGRGSLAEVMPTSLCDRFAAALRSDEAETAWCSEQGGSHRLAVCRETDRRPALVSDSVDASRASQPDERASRTPRAGCDVREHRHDDLAPLGDARGVRRIGVGELARLRSSAFGEEGPTDARGGAEGDPVLVGTLVHRLFQDASAADRRTRPASGHEAAAQEAFAARARELILPEEEEETVDADAVAARAAQLFVALRDRPDVTALLGSANCLYEVPFSLRLGQESISGTTTRDAVPVAGIVRGRIDCLAQMPDGRVVVVEIKTGARRPWHEVQLALYVRAARAICPRARAVEGRLVYRD